MKPKTSQLIIQPDQNKRTHTHTLAHKETIPSVTTCVSATFQFASKLVCMPAEFQLRTPDRNARMHGSAPHRGHTHTHTHTLFCKHSHTNTIAHSGIWCRCELRERMCERMCGAVVLCVGLMTKAHEAPSQSYRRRRCVASPAGNESNTSFEA